MHLDSVRELKQLVLTGWAAPPPTVALDADRPVPARGLVGVAPDPRGNGYRLALRLTEDDADLRSWVAALAGEAREEIDVRVVGQISALTHVDTPVAPGDLQRRVRPIHRGLSVAHHAVSAGTLGAFLTRPDAPRLLVLSNSHVLAAAGEGRPGDPVYQPGPVDGGTPDDRIGELLADVPLAPDGPNLVDAAVALVDDGVEVDPGGGDGPLAGLWSGDPSEMLREGVQKIGRTTGVTTGRVTAFEVDAVPVRYDTGILTFDDQIEIEGDAGAFSAGGDSGSVICSRTSRLAAALLFAGSSTGGSTGNGLTYANRLETVLSALDAALWGGTMGG